MGVMPTLPRSLPLTVADFEAVRDVDDGHRYELIDGTLLVTPAAGTAHQRAVARLYAQLEGTATPGHEVFVAPYDVRLGPDTVLQPDVLVAATATIEEDGVRGRPVLAVEVLSPSTRSMDLGGKRHRYEAAGVPAYWVVDPAVPELLVFELRDRHYVQVSHVSGADPLRLDLPWPVTLTPAALVSPPRR